MIPFDTVTWTADPILFSTGPFVLNLGLFELSGPIVVRWYALMFILGFAIGVKIMEYTYRRDGKDPERVYTLFMYCFIGTLIGARLGHCLFYAPDYYLAHPLEIFKTWKGGLASHGGTLGVFLAVLIYAKRDHLHPLWVLDRLGVAVGPCAALIRVGNLFNHEIYGHETTLPWGFRFVENLGQWQMGAQPMFSPPSHPTQIYEALCYLTVFVVNLWLYRNTNARNRRGLLLGTFFLGVFGSRFFIEFVKHVQEDFERDMMLDMGQWLSIPFILYGIYLIWHALRRPAIIEEKK